MFNAFQYPYMLLLLFIIPALIAWKYFFARKREYPTVHYSQLAPFELRKKTWRIRLRFIPLLLRYVVIALLIIALARPQTHLSRDEMNVEGVDIVLAMDVSASMLAEDFHPNRLEAAKSVAQEFIGGRPTDNIGAVAFAGESYTQCPPTTDHMMLLEQMKQLKSGLLQDGTAIGDGIATAINRMKDTKTKSKTIILLTDGVNNVGSIDPLTAADIAKQYKIRIYTIGIGTRGMARYPFDTPYGKQYQNVEVNIDEGLLRQIAKTTGGKYFRSTDERSLKTIFGEIDNMEKSIINVSYYSTRKDNAKPLLLAALVLLFCEALLRRTIFRQNP